VVAIEARGLILGGALARELGVGIAAARKPGKLPGERVAAEYTLEYGVDTLELHRDAVAHGARVLVHDDLLANGRHRRCRLPLSRAGRQRRRVGVIASSRSCGRERLVGREGAFAGPSPQRPS